MAEPVATTQAGVAAAQAQLPQLPPEQSELLAEAVVVASAMVQHPQLAVMAATAMSGPPSVPAPAAEAVETAAAELILPVPVVFMAERPHLLMALEGQLVPKACWFSPTIHN